MTRAQHHRRPTTTAILLTAAALAAWSAPPAAHAASGTWIGGADPNGVSLPWEDPANWLNGVIPGSTAGAAGTSPDVATFNTPGGSGTNAALDPNRNVAGITFDIPSGSGRSVGVTGGNTLFLSDNAIVQVTAASNTDSNPAIASPVILNGHAATFASYSTNSSAGLKLNGNISTAAPSGTATITLDGNNSSGVLTSNSQISGTITDGPNATVGIVKTGPGVWDLRTASANTYSGPTVINQGAIRLNSAGAMSPNSDYVINGNSSLRVSVSGMTGRSVTVNTATGYTSSSAPFSGSNSGVVINLANNAGPALTINMGSSTVTADVSLSTTLHLTGTVAGKGGVSMLSGPAGFRVTYNRDIDLGSVDRPFDVADTPGVSTDLRFTSAVTGSGGIVKTGPGTLKLEGSASYTGTTTASAGRVLLVPTTWDPVLNGAGGAAIADTARIELDYTDTPGSSPLSSAAAAIIAGRIRPTPADSTHTIAAVDDALSTVTLTRTYYGDLNLDGRVNADDYALLDRGRAKGLTGWTNGDLNYDGAINQQDYLLIDTTFGQTHTFSPEFLSQRESQFGAPYVSTLLSAVPEPSSLACLLAGLLPLLRRRRA